MRRNRKARRRMNLPKIPRKRRMSARGTKGFKKNRLTLRLARGKVDPRSAKVDYSLIYRRNLQELSVVILTKNDRTINPALIGHVQKLQPKEIIIVECGVEDSGYQGQFGMNVRFYSYPTVLGAGFGRAIGAMKTTGNILLFLDGTQVISTAELLSFVITCYGKADLALNNLAPYFSAKEITSPVNLVKSFLNKSLNLPNLKSASLTDAPHAMKRSAVEKIGYENLAIPPKAMAIAALQGLVILHGGKANTLSTNGQMLQNAQNSGEAEQVILGDHVEAFQYIQSVLGVRSFFADHLRRRDVISEVKSRWL